MILIYVCQKRNRKIHEYPWISVKSYPIGSMYAIYGNIYHQYTPNVSIYIYQHHGSYGYSFRKHLILPYAFLHGWFFSIFQVWGSKVRGCRGPGDAANLAGAVGEEDLLQGVFWADFMVLFDDLWQFMMVRWWFMIVCDGSMMIYGNLWWFDDDSWLFVMVWGWFIWLFMMVLCIWTFHTEMLT